MDTGRRLLKISVFWFVLFFGLYFSFRRNFEFTATAEEEMRSFVDSVLKVISSLQMCDKYNYIVNYCKLENVHVLKFLTNKHFIEKCSYIQMECYICVMCVNFCTAIGVRQIFNIENFLIYRMRYELH